MNSELQQIGNISKVRDTSINQSIEKAVSILHLYSRKDTMLTLNDIAQSTNLNKATAKRLCNTLEKVGFLEKINSAPASYYRLGIGLVKLGNLVLQSLDLTSRAKPYLKKITEKTGDNSYLFIEKNNKAHCIDLIKGTQAVHDVTVELGDTLNLNQGGAPLSILAHLSATQREEVFGDLKIGQEEKKSLEDQLKTILVDGYSVTKGTVSTHTAAVGAPIFDYQGKVVGALSIGGIIQRFSEERLAEITIVVKEAAICLSKELGWEEDD